MPSATYVTPIADTTDEPDETVILPVTAGRRLHGHPRTPRRAQISTMTTPTIQITNVTAPEPPSGSTSFVFTVSLTNPSSSSVTVNYATDITGATATAGASCSAGVDFVSVPLTGLIFAPGETSKQVNVTVCGDSDLEPDEIFFVNLSGNSANSVLPANTKGTGTITPQAPAVFMRRKRGRCRRGRVGDVRPWTFPADNQQQLDAERRPRDADHNFHFEPGND